MTDRVDDPSPTPAEPDFGALARAAYVKSWMRSLASVMRGMTDEEILESARDLEAQLARVQAAEERLQANAAAGRARLAKKSGP